MNKKLCVATFNGKFCFAADSTLTDLFSAAYEALSDKKMSPIDDLDIEIDGVEPIESIEDIPLDWSNREPLGAEMITEDFFESLDESKRITERLKRAGYELDPNFLEDLQHILNTPLGEDDGSESD